MTRLLLVANKTLASGEVADFVKGRMAVADEGELSFTLLVPATSRADQAASGRMDQMAQAGTGSWSSDRAADDAWEHARSRLEFGLGVLRGLGARVDGEVGDANPGKAISAVLTKRPGEYDEVALSTLPKNISRWLGMDIPHQIKRKFGVPVTVIKVKSVPA
jgi:hypothetical protein